ncbi:MAG: hypothetical protein ABSF77_20785 [Spirochaetia bacterium]|jgi:pimeloyl-ACP methyl ester carboxylesterase
MIVRLLLRRSDILRNLFRYGAWVRGEDFSSFTRIAHIDYSSYDVRPYPDRIRCPVLSLAGKGEGEIMLAQAREFHEAIPSKDKRLQIFSLERDGSDDHCQLDNISSGMQVIFDWLDARMAPRRGGR